jgi:spore germination cell wall hydrolase CwlJ-like protein
MEPTVTVKAEAGATERSGKATVAETVNNAALSRRFMAGVGRSKEKRR